MPEHYWDHAANEHSYLAWIRTGITVMVPGFIVEKFALFLASLRGIVADTAGPPPALRKYTQLHVIFPVPFCPVCITY